MWQACRKYHGLLQCCIFSVQNLQKNIYINDRSRNQSSSCNLQMTEDFFQLSDLP